MPRPDWYLAQDRSTHVIVSSVVLIIFSTAAVVLRLISRKLSGAGFWWDDWMIIVTLVFSWANNIINLACIPNGLGRHLESTSNPAGNLDTFFKFLYAFVILYCPAMYFLKVSIMLFLHRIFPIRWFRQLLIGFQIFNILLFSSHLPVAILQCIPISDFWHTLGGRIRFNSTGHCIDIMKFYLASGGINAFTDFVLLTIPIPLLRRLKTSRLQKLVLTAIFLVGLMVCPVSITRLVVLSNLNETDLTWNYTDGAVWTAAEPSVGVISACLPSLRPLLQRMFWGRRGHPTRRMQSTSTLTASLSGNYADKIGGTMCSTHDNEPTLLEDSNDVSLFTQAPGNVHHKHSQSAASHLSSYLPSRWLQNVSVEGGKANEMAHIDDHHHHHHQNHHNLNREGLNVTNRHMRQIQVSTTVTVTNTLDYRSDLF